MRVIFSEIGGMEEPMEQEPDADANTGETWLKGKVRLLSSFINNFVKICSTFLFQTESKKTIC